MEALLITWTNDQLTYPCSLDTPGRTTANYLKELWQERDNGCLQCLVVSICCSHYSKDLSDLRVHVFKRDNSLFGVSGTVNRAGIKEVTYQLYYPVGTQQPAWDLVKSGRLSLAARRESYKAVFN